MIMKLSWGLLNDRDAFWVKILRGKYRCGDGHIPLVRNILYASNIWKGIASTWDDFCRGLRWSVGNGHGVSF